MIRPLATGPLLLLARLRPGERLFIMLGGLKGAVPILLAALAVIAGVQREDYLYGLVYVVVLLSVAVQGTALPTLATRLGVPFRPVAHELAEVRAFRVAPGAYARTGAASPRCHSQSARGSEASSGRTAGSTSRGA